MPDTLDEKIIEHLARTPRGLDLLLQCSPFEQHKNLRQRLTEEFFFDHLFFGENDVFKTYTAEIKGLLSSGGKIMSLEGHSGVGKTTFVRRFIIDHADSFTFDYIDCSKYGGNVLRSELNATDIKNAELMIQRAQSEEEKARFIITRDKMMNEIVKSEKENSLTRIFRTYIKSIKITENQRNSFLYFLSRNKGALLDYLISDAIKTRVSNLSKDIGSRQSEEDAWECILKELQTNDSFLLLLTLIEYLRSKNSESDKPEVMIFDNLDAISLPLLHKDFIQLFYETQSAFGAVCELINLHNPGLNFAADQNFIFVIRDANNSSIAEHVRDNLGIQRIFFSCDPPFYRSIIAKRLEYYLNKVEMPLGRDAVARNIIALFNCLAEQRFYTDVLIPAFNMDYRRLSKALYEVIENFIPDVPLSKASQQRVDWSGAFNIKFPELSPAPITSFSVRGHIPIPKTYLNYKAEIPSEELNGFYGALLHGIIAKLHSVEFYETEKVSKKDGYCLASRMLLTLILNTSGIGKSQEFIIQNNRYAEVPLSYILKRAQGIYSEQEILKTLVGLYTVEDNDQMTYLVSFRQREVYNRHAYEDLDKILKDSSSWGYLLDYTSVVVTQAGFIFLRHLIVHYEFYSYLVYYSSLEAHAKRGSRPRPRPKPLFIYTGKRVGDEVGRHDFEESLAGTYNLVEKHAHWMHNFYLSKFKNREEKYLSSDFVFKHIGGIAKDEGLFHITRIVAAHIEYIDEYRRWLLKRSEARSPEAKKAINHKLLEFIESYIGLLLLWEDKDNKMEQYAEAVTNNIQTIKENADSWCLSVAAMKLE
jgi:hypothetical protein